MKNKLLKSRISNFFAYEWIMLLAVAVGAIVLWELVYSIASVRLTVGQQFKYYFDYNVNSVGGSAFISELYERDTLSFDVLDINGESVMEEYDVLSVRLSIYEGDVIFTDIQNKISDEEYNPETHKYRTENRANDIIDSCLMSGLGDNYRVYDYDRLIADCKTYLSGLLKDGETDMLDYSKLDEAKIDLGFEERLGSDNRFRSDEEKAEGKRLERERIKNLCADAKFLAEFLEADKELSAENSYFYRYTAGEQSLALTTDEDSKENWKFLNDKEKTEGRANARYGLKLEKFENADKYFQLNGADKDNLSADVVLMVFDFKEHQPELQFETVSFVTQTIKILSEAVEN